MSHREYPASGKTLYTKDTLEKSQGTFLRFWVCGLGLIVRKIDFPDFFDFPDTPDMSGIQAWKILGR